MPEELDSIREHCVNIQKHLDSIREPEGWMVARLAEQLDTLTHWVQQIVKKLEME